MSAKLIITLEGEESQLLAFAFRLKPVLEDLDIESVKSETVFTPDCPVCKQELTEHKGWWTCCNRPCKNYGAAVKEI